MTANKSALPTDVLIKLPTVDEVARVILSTDTWERAGFEWDDHSEAGREVYRLEARAVLDLVASRVPHWKPIEPGTAVDAGTRYRNEFPADGDAFEHVSLGFIVPPTGRSKWFIDSRTVSEPTPTAKVCRLLAHAHGVEVLPESLTATLDELGLTLAILDKEAGR